MIYTPRLEEALACEPDFVSCGGGEGAGRCGFILHTDKISTYLSRDEVLCGESAEKEKREELTEEQN